MPTYFYHCENENCEKQDFDVIAKITDEKLKVCPTCGSEVERVVTGGTGFTAGKDFYSPIGRSK